MLKEAGELKIYTYFFRARSEVSRRSSGLSVFAKNCKDTISELYICTIQEENITAFQVFSSRFAQNTSYKSHKVITYATCRYKA